MAVNHYIEHEKQMLTVHILNYYFIKKDCFKFMVCN